MRAKDRVVLPSRPRRRKKKKLSGRRLRFFAVAAGCALVFIGLLALVRAERFRIGSIDISGAETVSADEVRDAVRTVLAEAHNFIVPGDFIPLVNNDEIIRRLRKQFPRLRAVRIAPSSGRTLAVVVEERELWAILCTGGADETAGTASSTPPSPSPINNELSSPPCAYVDREGFAYGVAPQLAGSLILKITTDAADIPLGASALEAKLIDRIIFLADHLPATIGEPITDISFSVNVPSELGARAASGFWMRFKRDDEGERALAVLARILRDEIKSRRKQVDYIDLRFGNKVFYKYQ